MAAGKKPSRRAERAQAFQILYALSFSDGLTRQDLIRAFRNAPEREPEEDGADLTAAPEGFAWELVQGVWEKAPDLDEALSRHSQNWRVERMGKVEMTLLRMALFEMMFRPDIPAKVSINEALELSKQFGDTSSRGFINGILDAAGKAIESDRAARG